MFMYRVKIYNILSVFTAGKQQVTVYNSQTNLTKVNTQMERMDPLEASFAPSPHWRFPSWVVGTCEPVQAGCGSNKTCEREQGPEASPADNLFLYSHHHLLTMRFHRSARFCRRSKGGDLRDLISVERKTAWIARGSSCQGNGWETQDVGDRFRQSKYLDNLIDGCLIWKIRTAQRHIIWYLEIDWWSI